MLRLWVGMMLVPGIAAGAGYVLLQGASPAVVAGIETFAAGVIITMPAERMVPRPPSTPGGSSVS